MSMPDLAFTAATLGILWFLVCNERTFSQRCVILRSFPGRAGWQSLHRDFSSVGYRKHLWRLFTFRDPRQLYSADIAQVMGWSAA